MPLFGTVKLQLRSSAGPHLRRARSLSSKVPRRSCAGCRLHPPRLLPAFTERPQRACAVMIGLSGRRNLSSAALEPPPPLHRPAHALTGPSRNLARLGARPYFAGNWLSAAVIAAAGEIGAAVVGAPALPHREPPPLLSLSLYTYRRERRLQLSVDLPPPSQAAARPVIPAARQLTAAPAPRRLLSLDRLPGPCPRPGPTTPRSRRSGGRRGGDESHPPSRRRRPPHPRVCPINGVGKRHRGILWCLWRCAPGGRLPCGVSNWSYGPEAARSSPRASPVPSSGTTPRSRCVCHRCSCVSLGHFRGSRGRGNRPPRPNPRLSLVSGPWG